MSRKGARVQIKIAEGAHEFERREPSIGGFLIAKINLGITHK